jgi:hypothetical protein
VGCETWEDIVPRARERVQLAQDDDGLDRQGDDVDHPHLHALGGDTPLSGVKVDLRPRGLTQLAGPHERQGR